MDRMTTLFDGYEGRLIVVSNRGSCTFKKTSSGLQATPSVSGLVSALEPILKEQGGIWVAWGGRYSTASKAMGLSLPLPEKNPRYVNQEVLLSRKEVTQYYDGFSNNCLWPLCHSFLEKTIFNEDDWRTYIKVNKKYARVLAKVAKPRDMIWVQDYHLALVPRLVREHNPLAALALFWHIPFPPVEIFETLPWARDLIQGILGCDLIAFHTESYTRNFLMSVEEITGAKVDYRNKTIEWRDRTIKVAALPIGLDCKQLEGLAQRPDLRTQAQQIRDKIGGQYLILGVDRLDYSKGIIERLEAIEYLLENYPEYRGKLTFLQIAAPSRTSVPAYSQLRRRVEETVGRINGRFTHNYHSPIQYLFQSLDKENLVAHYLASDMLLVTPLRDGLNLVAKEYVVVNTGKDAILVLSPLAGVAFQLKQAIIANPYYPKALADSIVNGLKLTEGEKRHRMNQMYKTVKGQDIFWWWKMIQENWIASYRHSQSKFVMHPSVKKPARVAN